MKFGLMTFHGSHNHGSMLQAYATQRLVEKTGNECEIINFRMRSQREYYALYQTKYGVMRLFRGLTLLPMHMARASRAAKFESFLSTHYHLSGDVLETYEDLESISDRYDAYLSGSDQIWSPQIPEFRGSSVDYTNAYFLSFVSNDRPRIAYACSTGEATYEDLLAKKSLLDQYAAVSVRGKSGAELVERVVGRNVPAVIDPTLMLDASEWREIGGAEPLIKGDYILLYSLRGIRTERKWGEQLSRLGKKLGMKVVCVSPFYPVLASGIHNYVNVGPEDFLNLVDHASLMFTDTFHGTAFAVNFGKSFYSLTPKGSGDNRKRNVLKAVGLESRAISDIKDVSSIEDWRLDPGDVRTSQARLAAERERCMGIFENELAIAAKHQEA